MTASDRIFLRRHYQAFSALVPGQEISARRATERAAYAFGISVSKIAQWFDISESVVYSDITGATGRSWFLGNWKATQSRLQKARIALRIAEGLERAAAERARARGLELSAADLDAFARRAA